jgi:chlorophyll synthase
MARVAIRKPFDSAPDLLSALELLKPITWFPPMWAFGCGLVCTVGATTVEWWRLALGVLLTGPIVCGCSQAVNDWFDREVDALNEPNRPIPSGRVPGRWGLYIAILWTALGIVAAIPLGVFAFRATLAGLLLAWAYSAPPVRLKLNGWWGNSAVGACYEGLPWITGAAIVGGGSVSIPVMVIAALYSAGAHGIMTLNDFKSVAGDRRLGVRSLPVQLGVERAARLACWTMALPQVAVALLLLAWGRHAFGFGVLLLLIVQLRLMGRLLERPRELAPWYNGTGVTLYVLGMLLSAVALRSVLPL